jgi:hypothetical protein
MRPWIEGKYYCNFHKKEIDMVAWYTKPCLNCSCMVCRDEKENEAKRRLSDEGRAIVVYTRKHRHAVDQTDGGIDKTE